MSTESKNHHYNPQSVLKRFRLSKNQVITLDKNTLKTFPSPINKTGSQNYFNTIKIEGQSLNFESLFDINDSILADLLDEIILRKSVKHLTDYQEKQLASVIAHQIIRTKRTRTETADLVKLINNFTKEVAEKMDGSPKLIKEFNDEEEEKLITIIKLQNVNEIIDSLLDKHLILVDATQTQKYFWTSDHPVVMNNSFEYGRIGLDQKGIEIYFPISKKYAIGYYCKSIAAKYSIARNEHLIIKTLLDTLENKGNLILTNENVKALNHLQIVNSSRFVYAPELDFEIEIDFLKNNERYRFIRTKIGTGKQINVNSSLPMGNVIVFYTRDKHFMIKAESVVSDSEILIQSSEIGKFIFMTKDDPIERLEHYKDQYEVRGMNQIKVISLNLLYNQIEIGFVNPAMKFLMEMMKKKENESNND